MTPEEKIFEEWKQKFMAIIRKEVSAQGWLEQASHLHPFKFTEVGERIADWVKNNPAPPNPHQKLPKPKPVHAPHTTGVHGVGNMNKQIEHAQMLHRMNQGRRGSSTLGTLVLLGGMTTAGVAWKVGVFALKWVVEEKMWDLADRNVINPMMTAVDYARMPATRAQLDYAYMNYCDFSLARVANYGITPKLLSKEEWCWREYGINMSVLR